MEFEVGDCVEKISGYRMPGIVIGKCIKLDRKTILYVVECPIDQVSGLCHIYQAKNLKLSNFKYLETSGKRQPPRPVFVPLLKSGVEVLNNEENCQSPRKK